MTLTEVCVSLPSYHELDTALKLLVPYEIVLLTYRTLGCRMTAVGRILGEDTAETLKMMCE